VDAGRYAGVYDRHHVRTTLTAQGQGLRALIEVTSDSLSELAPPLELDLVAVDEVTFVGRAQGSPSWIPFVFYELPDGRPYVHFSARANPRVS